jgi:ADP-ribosylglycohydrolase
MSLRTEDNYLGAFIGAAIGDALGSPIETMSMIQIERRFGKGGITQYMRNQELLGAISDDTQLMLFTAESLMQSLSQTKGVERSIVNYIDATYLGAMRWLRSQNLLSEQSDYKFANQVYGASWLTRVKDLFVQRNPNETIINSLRFGVIGTTNKPTNNSKSPMGMVRMMPVGLFFNDYKTAFTVAMEGAAATGGHYSGYLSAGFYAAFLTLLRDGATFEDAMRIAVEHLQTFRDYHEIVHALTNCTNAINSNVEPSLKVVESLGSAWVAEEVLSLSLYCAYVYKENFEKAVLLSVNHGGDSDTCGFLTGGIVGLMLGEKQIPQRFKQDLEFRVVISQIARDFLIRYEGSEEWVKKYPGGSQSLIV